MAKAHSIRWRFSELQQAACRLGMKNLGIDCEAEFVNYVMLRYLDSQGHLKEARECLGSAPSGTDEYRESAARVPDRTLIFRDKSQEKKAGRGESEGGECRESAARESLNGKPELELKPEQLAMVPLAERLKRLIELACSPEKYDLGTPPANEVHKCAVVLEQVVRIDGVRHDELRPLAIWMLESDFWQGQMLSIAKWRKKSERNDRAKILNARKAWMDAGSPGAGRSP